MHEKTGTGPAAGVPELSILLAAIPVSIVCLGVVRLVFLGSGEG
jgi:hypothetical protein